MRRIHLTFAALVIVAAVTLAACGGSSSKGGASGSSASSGDFCTLVKRYKHDKTLNSRPTNLADEKKQVSAVKVAIDSLTASAPKEIKAEMQKAQHLSNDVARTVNSATSAQDLSSKVQGLQSEANTATAAEQKANNYMKQHCGVSLSSGG